MTDLTHKQWLELAEWCVDHADGIKAMGFAKAAEIYNLSPASFPPEWSEKGWTPGKGKRSPQDIREAWQYAKGFGWIEGDPT